MEGSFQLASAAALFYLKGVYPYRAVAIKVLKPRYDDCRHLDGQGGFFEHVNMATGYHKFPLSQYAQSLELSARARYLLKIDAMKEDPYLLKKSDLDEFLKGLPSVDYTDIVDYLVYSTSYLTAKEIKAKKSLQAYNNFLSGWVLETAIKSYEENCLVMGTVSQIFLSSTFCAIFPHYI